MIHVDVRTNVKSVQKNLGFLARKQLPKATSMALNKTATSLRGFTVREGKKAMGASNIKSKEVRAKTFILKANIRKLFAVFFIFLPPSFYYISLLGKKIYQILHEKLV